MFLYLPSSARDFKIEDYLVNGSNSQSVSQNQAQLSDIGSIFNDLSGTTATQQFNALEAEKTRKHQIEMAKNQFQWAVNDIKKAGLNPALMYASGGQGNTAPSGAMASSGSGSAGEILGAAGSLMNSINTARYLDIKSNTNEFSASQAYTMYKFLSKIFRK